MERAGRVGGLPPSDRVGRLDGRVVDVPASERDPPSDRAGRPLGRVGVLPASERGVAFGRAGRPAGGRDGRLSSAGRRVGDAAGRPGRAGRLGRAG